MASASKLKHNTHNRNNYHFFFSTTTIITAAEGYSLYLKHLQYIWKVKKKRPQLLNQKPAAPSSRQTSSSAPSLAQFSTTGARQGGHIFARLLSFQGHGDSHCFLPNFDGHVLIDGKDD